MITPLNVKKKHFGNQAAKEEDIKTAQQGPGLGTDARDQRQPEPPPDVETWSKLPWERWVEAIESHGLYYSGVGCVYGHSASYLIQRYQRFPSMQSRWQTSKIRTERESVAT
jgi:hypothetical protein